MKRQLRLTVCTLAGLALTVGTSRAAVLVGFNLPGEITDVVTAGHVISGVVIDGIAPTEGDAYAYLTTGPEEAGVDGSNGVGDSGIDRTGDGFTEGDVAIGTVDFSLAAPMWVGFDYDLVTSEISGGIADPFEIKLDGTTVASGAVGFKNGPLVGLFEGIPEADFDGALYAGPDGSVFEDGRIGWTTVDLGVLAAGDYTLEFFVGDDDDLIVDTALLVDNLRTRDPNPQIPEPATLGIWTLLGLIGLAFANRKRR